MIKLEPRQRLTVPQILTHSWLKETNEIESEHSDEDEGNREDSKQGKGGKTDANNGIDLASI